MVPPLQPSRSLKIASAAKVSNTIFLTQQLSCLTEFHPGQPVSHQFAKELLAGFAGAEVDRLCETKGLDYIDREKARRQARDNAVDMYDSHYGNQVSLGHIVFRF